MPDPLISMLLLCIVQLLLFVGFCSLLALFSYYMKTEATAQTGPPEIVKVLRFAAQIVYAAQCLVGLVIIVLIVTQSMLLNGAGVVLTILVHICLLLASSTASIVGGYLVSYMGRGF